MRKYRHFSSSFQSWRAQTASASKLSAVFPLLGGCHNRFFSMYFFSLVNPPEVARISGRQITELLRFKDENVFLLGRRGVNSSRSDEESEEDDIWLLFSPSVSFLLGLGDRTSAKFVSLFHLVTVFSSCRLQEESGLWWPISEMILDCRCKICFFFFRNNLSPEFLSFCSSWASFCSVAWLIAFRTSKVFALFLDKSFGGSLLRFASIVLAVDELLNSKNIREKYWNIRGLISQNP